MNKRTITFPLAAIILLAWSSLHAEPAKPAASSAAAGIPSLRPSYDSFRLVHTRNVFDPDRRPIRPVYNPSASVAPGRADYVALTGTMLSGDKTYAFFSGSRPEFNKVLSVQGKITNATIAGITPLNIEIERDGKRTTVAVGQTVPFDNQTVPGVPPATDMTDSAPASTASSSSGPAPASAPLPAASRYGTGTAAPGAIVAKGPPGNIDEIRRRMMEKRQQELK